MNTWIRIWLPLIRHYDRAIWRNVEAQQGVNKWSPAWERLMKRYERLTMRKYRLQQIALYPLHRNGGIA